MKIAQKVGVIVGMALITLQGFSQDHWVLGRWIYVTETFSEDLTRANGPLAEIDNKDSLEAQIIREKFNEVGKYEMIFDSKGRCSSQGVQFRYAINDSELTLNFEKYAIAFVDYNRLLMCSSEGACALFYRDTYYYQDVTLSQINEDLALTSYDRLLIQYILEKRNQTTRADLFKTTTTPKHRLGDENVEHVLKKYLGDYYVGADQDSINSTTMDLSFIIEADGTTSAVGLDFTTSHQYELINDAFRELNGNWIPFRNEGTPIPCMVHMPIRLRMHL